MIDVKNKNLTGLKFIDLFAGLGGFRLALESFGAECVYSNEWDKYAQEVYEMNFGDMPEGDITLVNENSVPNHDILCAGFPCQAFSISGKQKGFEDSRGTLFFDVARIVNTLKVVRNTMIDLGYDFYSDVLNSLDFGIPQKRERIYMVCFRKDLNIKNFTFPKPFKLSTFVENLLLPDEDVSNLIINRPDMVLKDTKIKGNSNKTIRIGTVGKGGQGERIYSPKGIAITLSAYGGGVFSKTGGYLVNGKTRKLHPRECARIMGYPDSYLIHPSSSQAYKQFGNSVVVNVLQYITKNMGEALNHEYSYI